MTSYYLSALPDTQEIKASSGAITVTGNIKNAMTDDTTTNSTMYPVWVTASTGNLPVKVSSTKLTFNPSTGLLTSSALATASLQLTTNQINQVSSNSDTGQVAINYNGYLGAQTKFRDCVIFDGKGAEVVSVTGSTKAVSFAGVITCINSGIKITGSSTGKTTFASANTGSSDYTLTFPAVTDTVAGITLQQNSQSAAYTTVLADAGKQVLHPASDDNARTFTIDSNANVAYPAGTMITFVNRINTLSIAITSDTMYLAGTTSTGTRTLAVNGVATALKIDSTTWIISGSGLA